MLLIRIPARAHAIHFPFHDCVNKMLYLFIWNLETKYNAKAIGTYRHTYKSDIMWQPKKKRAVLVQMAYLSEILRYYIIIWQLYVDMSEK